MSAPRPLVSVCRGCCCGTEKHPDTDHGGQLRALEASGIPVRVVDCLDACEHSNVVVVHPAPAARRRGSRPVWFGRILDPETVGHIGAWATAGGPGAARMPAALRGHVITRPGRA